MTPHGSVGRDCPPGLGSRTPALDGISRVRVVIPARDEQTRIGRCLDSVLAAVAHLQCSRASLISVRVVVVLDQCVDRSADIVARYGRVEALTANVGNVGAARALGASRLLPRTTDRCRATWLANTDADSIVPRDWLTRMLSEAEHGADIVLGTIEPNVSAGQRLRVAWQARHSVSDGHRHVHGANIGVRASTYLELGGWSARSTGEDVALVCAAEAAGSIRIARIGSIPVTTSARFIGRAPHGFAHYLQVLNDEIDRPPAVSLAT